MLGIIWQLVRKHTINKVQKSINRSSSLRASTQLTTGKSPVVVPSKVQKKLEDPISIEIDDPLKEIEEKKEKYVP